MAEMRRYFGMEPVLNFVNKHFIALPENDTKHSMKILKSLLKILIDKMKESDDLFKILYREIFHGGSYFEDLRIGQAKEYDLDLVLAIPRFAKLRLSSGDVPGFVHLEVMNFMHLLNQPEFRRPLRNFGNLCDNEHYLNTKKVLQWIESVLDKALQGFMVEGDCFLHDGIKKFKVTKTSSGPAITLKLEEVESRRRKSSRGPLFSMDIDLVPAFVFGQKQWPCGFRNWPEQHSAQVHAPVQAEFFIVPKAPKVCGKIKLRERNWRLSFQKQERALMANKQNMKPTVRLLKKLRDTLEQNAVASYYIKTTILWVMEERIQEEKFWKQSLGYVFMTALKKYYEFLNNGNIPYYWNENNNLLCNVNRDTLRSFSNRLLNVINDIENNLDSPALPTTITRHLLNNNEQGKFEENYRPHGNSLVR